MEKNKYSKVLTVSLVIIIIGIFGTLGYFGYSLLNENNTKKKYTDAANEFEQKVLGGSSSVSNSSAKNDKKQHRKINKKTLKKFQKSVDKM